MEAAKERLARGYSRTATRYDALAGHMYLTGIRRLLPRVRVPPMPAILDVGSGTGVNLLEAARWFAPARLLCGIDISEGMVAVARAKAAALGVPAQFVVGDAERLPYPDGIFDLVICNSVLHWFRDKGAALREMHRVLRPGGQLVLLCAVAPGFGEWFVLVDGLLRAVKGSGAPPAVPILPTGVEVRNLMAGTGFLLEHVANPIQLHHITHVEPFVQLMSTVAPHPTADLSPEEEAQFERLVAAAMRTGWPAGFPNTWAAFEAVATRVQ